MARKKLIRTYHDIEEGVREDTNFFFLENVLKARIALDIGTGLHDYDEEVNVYVAYLLMSLVTTDALIRAKPYISAYDGDVRKYLEEHPGARNEYRVYRENADYGLVAETVFSGQEHPGSYYERVLSERDESGRIALYYQLAASALSHLTCANTTLVHVLASIADNYGDVEKLLRKVSKDYFELIERLSDGSLYHMQLEAAGIAAKNDYDRRLDEFLKAYYEYTLNPTEEGRRQVMGLVEGLRALNKDFNFDERKLSR